MRDDDGAYLDSLRRERTDLPALCGQCTNLQNKITVEFVQGLRTVPSASFDIGQNFSHLALLLALAPDRGDWRREMRARNNLGDGCCLEEREERYFKNSALSLYKKHAPLYCIFINLSSSSFREIALIVGFSSRSDIDRLVWLGSFI
jgi:hypothetical protein